MFRHNSIVRRSLLGLTAFAAFSGGAQAQSISSFSLSGDFSGISILTSDQLTYVVSVGANPKFNVGGTDYTITDVIGFWVLSDVADFNASNSNFDSGVGSWKERNNNSGTGAIAGWRASNANVGLQPGESETFSFASLTPSSQIDGYGLHVRVEGTFPGSSGNTGHIRTQDNPVPEPTSIAVLGIGAAALLRRRSRK